MTRHLSLLLATADDLERGAVPLNETFLCEHGVTLDESVALADAMATVLRGYVHAPQRLILALLACATAKSAEEADALVATVEASHARAQIIKSLGALNVQGSGPVRTDPNALRGRHRRTGCAARLRELAGQPYGTSITVVWQDYASIHASALQAGIKVRCLTLPGGSEMRITRIDPNLSVKDRLKTSPVNTGRRTHLKLDFQKLAKKKAGESVMVVAQSLSQIYTMARQFGFKISYRVTADGSIKITRNT